MPTRSDNYTASRGQETFYSDFTKNLRVHPNTGQLIRLTNSRSVKESLKNLVMTSQGERLYQPLVGGNIGSLLFEPMDDFTANDIRDAIVTTIRNNEPRVTNATVMVTADPDENQYTVNIAFTIVNRNEVDQLQLILVRNR